jgi:flagellar protein FliO/FliZ
LTRLKFYNMPMFALSCLLFFMFQKVGFAAASGTNGADSSNVPDIDGLQQFSLIGTMVKVILVLIIMVGLIVLLIYFLSQKNKSWMSNRGVRLLSGLPLGQNKSLQVVQVGRKIYLVGVGENVHLIDKVDDADEVESIIESIQSQPSLQNAPITSIVSNWLRKMPNRSQAGNEKSSTFQEVLLAKISSLSSRKKIFEQLEQEDHKRERSNDT